MGRRKFRTVLRALFPPQVLAGLTSGLVLTFVGFWSSLVFSTSMYDGYGPFRERLAAQSRLETRSVSTLQKNGNSTTVAERLAKEVSVLVWVMTAPDTLHDRATMVRQTWGKRADTLLFFSSVSNATFPTVGLNVSEGREHLTAKTIQGFRYVYKHHFHEADWFLKVDDDTFVVMENLRYFLSEEAPRDPVYYGHHFGLVVAQGYYNVGVDSVSDYPITFHYIYPGKMQRLEFLIYHLRAHGLNRGFQNLNVPPSRRVSIKPIYRLPPYAPVAAPRIPAHP